MAAVRREMRGGDGGWWAPAPAPAMGVDVAVASPQAPAAMAARITPAVLFITVVLAVVLLVSGLLHVLRRLFLKSHHANARAEAVERQLQQLFHLHEDGGGAGPGLDQADIDALPAFAYGELAGAVAGGGKRPFDCAVCLCEFAADDRLRLLPLCGHAFHAACIDTWLRSSSTCPLCRAALTARALAAATAAAAETAGELDLEEQKQEQEAPPSEVVLPVRLGRFKKLQGGGGEASTSSCLDSRRCYSMGSYQYVLAEDHLMVSVHWPNGSVRRTAAGEARARSHDDQSSGKKLCAATRGDSFSVSKIWQWRGGDRSLPVLCSGAASPPADDGLPWASAAARENGTRTRQDSDTS